MKYIVKISPEISIKSKPVRKRCVLKLNNNIKKHLNYNDIKVNVTGTRDRINVEGNSDKIWEVLSCVPWIAHFMEVESFNLPEKEDEVFHFVFEKTKDFYLDKIKDKTFVVRVKRSGQHNFKSIDLERYVWGGLLKYSTNAKVKVKNPEVTVHLEVKDKKIHIIKYRVPWIWGYPVWFQDKVLSLISWGFDSWVSTYSMMKRWCEVDYLFFNLWWSAHELWVKQVAHYLWKTFSVPHKRARFITVNFEELVKVLVTEVHHKYRWVLLKRYMLKVASIISEDHYFALVKWDSLWQVSSQTLKNMHVIDKMSTNLVLRPLISYNKQEIVDISKNIGTYNFACNMPEYCWVISDKPSTGAKLEDILFEEEKIDDNLIISLVENRKTEFLKNMMEQYNWENSTSIETLVLPWDGDVVIDIREEFEFENEPIKLEAAEIINIPFFDINFKFKDLNPKKTYLLYCKKWILSNLHWLYLKEKGYENVKVLRFVESDTICNI